MNWVIGACPYIRRLPPPTRRNERLPWMPAPVQDIPEPAKDIPEPFLNLGRNDTVGDQVRGSLPISPEPLFRLRFLRTPPPLTYIEPPLKDMPLPFLRLHPHIFICLL